MTNSTSASEPEAAARAGATLLPRLRPGGPRPDLGLLARFPPAGVIAFGRAPDDGRTLPGLAEEIDSVRADCLALSGPEPFFCCDLEEGAGLHFDRATRLVPALALAAADAGRARRGDSSEPDWVRSAAALTAVEARENGVQLVLAPVVDVNTRCDNPIIAVRSFGDEPGAVARRALAFARGLHDGGAGACYKHWPGHGDTDADSHLELPRVEAGAELLEARELAPYRELLPSALDADRGTDCVMVAHLDVPALTGEQGLPTTLSRRAIEEHLRVRGGFGGTVLSDGIDMGAVAALPGVHARAVAAGCDGLLCPADPGAAAEELLAAVRAGDGLTWLRLGAAAARMERLRAALLVCAPTPRSPDVHAACAPGTSRSNREAFAAALAVASLVAGPSDGNEGWPDTAGRGWELAVIGVERPEAEHALHRALAPPAPPGADAVAVIAAACRVSAGRGRAGLAPADEAALRSALDALAAAGRERLLVWFGSPQLLPANLLAAPGVPWLLATAPTPPLAQAVRLVLAGGARARGDLPLRPG